MGALTASLMLAATFLVAVSTLILVLILSRRIDALAAGLDAVSSEKDGGGGEGGGGSPKLGKDGGGGEGGGSRP